MNLIRRVLRLPLTVPAAAATVVILIVTIVVPALPSRELKIRVQLESTFGSQVALYLNDFSRPPQLRPLLPGDRQSIEFEGPSGDIERMRVDVLDANGATVRHYGIDVLGDDGNLLSSFPPADLARWATYSASDNALVGDALQLRATGPATSIDAFRTVLAPSRLPGPVESVVHALKTPERFLKFGLVALGVGAFLLGLLARRGPALLAVGAAASFVGILVLDAVLSNPSGVAPVSEGVGRASYLGLSLPTNLRAIYALYASVVVVALVGAALWSWRRRRQGTVETRPARTDFPALSRGAITFAAFVAVAALGVFVPDLREVVRQATTGQYAPGWDSENLLAWSEFAARGLVPMNDFWYPYGNFSIFETGLLKGKIAFGLYQLTLFAGFWWVFWISAGRRLFASSAAALALLAAEPMVGELYRYGLALVIALAYTCIDPEASPRTRRLTRLVFGLLVTLGLFLDPILVGYAAVGVLVLLVVDLARRHQLGFRWWFGRLTADFGLPAIGLVAAATVAALRGQLDAFVELYTSLGPSAVYSAEPAPLRVGLDAALEYTAVMIWLPAVMLAVGLFGRLTTSSPTLAHGLASRLLVTGCVAIPLLLKHVVRTTPTQPLLIVLVGLMLVLLWASAYPSAWPAVGALCGLAVSLTMAYPGPERIRDELKELPAVVASDLRLLLLDRHELRNARNERFTEERFAAYPNEVMLARDIRSRPEVRDDTSLYILGDAPIVYSLTRQRPPWQINVYNTSLIDDQRRTVEWLEEERPPLVVVDRTSAEFDNVPNDVRIPLVFQYVIANYQYDHAIGPYDVLLPRKDPIDVEYWNGVAGADSVLGRVLDVSSYDELETCSTGPDCRPFLRLTAPSKSWTGRVNVPLRFGEDVVWVRFDAAGEQRVYTVSIERLWARALSANPKVARPLPPGWRATIVRGIQPDDTLY